MFDRGTFLGGLLSGGVAGSIITLFFTDRRDKRQRRCSFLGFLKQWRSEIECGTQSTWGTGYNTSAEVAYRAKLPSFQSEVERVRDVFIDSAAFDSLTKRLATLGGKDWESKQPRDAILGALDDLIPFAAQPCALRFLITGIALLIFGPLLGWCVFQVFGGKPDPLGIEPKTDRIALIIGVVPGAVGLFFTLYAVVTHIFRSKRDA